MRALRRVEPAPPDRPERPPGETLPMQSLTRRIALDDEWSPELAVRITQLFDGLAPEWHTRSGEARLAATRDALARGGLPTGGTCLEVGSGTGIHTPLLAEHFAHVVSIDLAPEMLALAPPALSYRMRADAAQLPLRQGCVDAVVCVNAFLFPREYERVLRDSGAVAFVSTSGDRTPIWLPPADVAAAMPGTWEGVTSEAGWGTWTVVRRGAR